MLYAFFFFYQFDHFGYIRRDREDIHADRCRCCSIDWYALMDRQYIGPVIRNDLQHIGQQPRLIIHLNNKCDRFPSYILMKRKYIILVFVK